MPYEDYFKDVNANASIEEKIEAIKYNISSSATIRRQISAFSVATLNVENTIIPEEVVKTESITIDNEIYNEINSLYDKISLLDTSDLSEEEIINKIRSIMPNVSSITLNKIKLLLYKEYIIYSRMLLTSSTDSEIKEIESIIKSISTKIDLLDELEELENEEEITTETLESNNIFFLISQSGNVIALESLRKNVPKDYYPVFKELILGLKKGKLKGIKRLYRKGYFELKSFKVRVIFDKLSNGNYIILDCFMKKVDTSISYRNMLNNRTNQYQNSKDLYLNNINNSEFIKKHEGYLAEILSLLDSKELEGDDISETRSI